MSKRAKKRLNHSNYDTPAKGNGSIHSKSDLTAPDSPTMLERVELPVIDETVRSAVISLIEHDANIMRKILDIVTKELVLRLTADPNFTERIAKQITETGIVNEIKQDLYASCSLDQATSADNLDAMGQRVAKLERDNNALRIELDTQEQYSRRNCLLLHGVPETQADTAAAALEVIESKLNVKLPRNAIDRSHRLGRTTGGVSGGGKPRPIILKFVSYQDRSAVFARKKQLKGSKIVLTENLTRRRAELLAKARATAGVKATWTADGRIVCLLEDGRKVSVDTENDLRERIA